MSRGAYGHGSPSTWMSHCSTASPGRHGVSVYDSGSGTAIMSGSAGVWPIGPAAKPAKPAPPPVRTPSASSGIIFAHGFPCISTNMAKKNSTPSDSARARSCASTSDMCTLRCGRCGRQSGSHGCAGALKFSQKAAQTGQKPRSGLGSRVHSVSFYDTIGRGYDRPTALGSSLSCPDPARGGGIRVDARPWTEQRRRLKGTLTWPHDAVRDHPHISGLFTVHMSKVLRINMVVTDGPAQRALVLAGEISAPSHRSGVGYQVPFGCPGIQSVPARGTWAMAAASTVSATRSSGSRLWTLDLPQARASAAISMAIVLR